MTVHLTTFDKVKEALQPSDDLSSAVQTRIESLIAEVSEDLRIALGRQLEVVERTAYLDARRGQTMFFLDAYPITSIATVNADSGRDFDESTALDADGYYAKTGVESGRVDLAAPIAPGRGVLKVTWTGGMGASTAALMTAYPQLAGVATLEVVNRFQRTPTPGGGSRSSGADVNVTYEALNWLPLTRRVIRNLKAPALVSG